MDESKIAELKDKYGEIVVVETKAGELAFRAPRKAEYDRYLSFLFDEKKRSKAPEVLVRACVVYPSVAEFDAITEKAPGIVTTCSGPVLELAGQEDSDGKTKKY